MPLRVRAFTTTLRVQVPKACDDAARRALAQAAEQTEARVVREQTPRAGVAPAVVPIVNGRRRAPYAGADPRRPILIEFHYMREVASEAVRLLTERGPKLKGAWKSSITVFVDEAEASLAAITERTRLVQVAPLVVYARRLEIGRRESGQPFIVNAPPNLVQETALMLRKFYAAVADVRISFVEAAGGRADRARARRRGGKAPRPMRYPAIVIRARDPSP